MNRLLSVALVALLSPLLDAQGRLWLVDSNGGPGIHFTDIPPAIVAASAGDRIEVRGSGPYAAFRLDKGLEIEAISNALVPSCSVENIVASQWARVLGFLLNAGADERDPRTGVAVRNCRGPVLLSSLHVVRQLDGQAAEVVASDAVLIVDSNLHGGRGCVEFSSFAKAGLRIDNSHVVVQRCRISGGSGSGAHYPFFQPERGAPGLTATGSDVLVAETEVTGGNGGFGRIDPPNTCVPGGQGGAAAVVDRDGLFMAACTLTGGIGGNAPTGCPSGPRGEACVAPGPPGRVTNDCTVTGALVNVSVIAALPCVRTPRAAARGSAATFILQGRPGQTMLLLFGQPHAHIVLGGFDGPLLLAPVGLLALGGVQIGAGGTAPFLLQIPNLPELANQFVFVQGATLAAGPITFTNLGDLRIL